MHEWHRVEGKVLSSFLGMSNMFSCLYYMLFLLQILQVYGLVYSYEILFFANSDMS